MAKSIMLQGTASGVGKSTLTAALCRYLANSGLKVATFKAQNMSSNAFVLDDGRMMAASQAIAARACRIKPDPVMNPVLLIPNRGIGCDIILNGSYKMSMKSDEYYSYKQMLFDSVLECYNTLITQYDIVVVEGAGSPVEMNLKENDIVNMGFATAVGCPVVLVGDVSRGGVFASVFGTLCLFSKAEQNLVAGVIINKFSGNITSFEKACNMLEEITNKKILGVVPHCEINIEDEDNLCDGILKTSDTISKALGQSYESILDKELDKLANILEDSVDMSYIMKIINEEI